MKLNIITACIRSYNLQVLLDSFTKAKSDYQIDFIWYVVFDMPFLDDETAEVELNLGELRERCSKNNIELQTLICNTYKSPVNLALNVISDGYICFIDDDNIMHHNYIKGIYPSLENNIAGVLYYQIMKHGMRIVYEYNIKPGCIDTAQFTLKRDLIGDIRWPEKSTGCATPDGTFIYQIDKKNPRVLQIIREPLCYYNYLFQKPSKP